MRLLHALKTILTSEFWIKDDKREIPIGVVCFAAKRDIPSAGTGADGCLCGILAFCFPPDSSAPLAAFDGSVTMIMFSGAAGFLKNTYVGLSRSQARDCHMFRSHPEFANAVHTHALNPIWEILSS